MPEVAPAQISDDAVGEIDRPARHVSLPPAWRMPAPRRPTDRADAFVDLHYFEPGSSTGLLEGRGTEGIGVSILKIREGIEVAPVNPENSGHLDQKQRLRTHSSREGSQGALGIGQMLHHVREEHHVGLRYLVERLRDEAAPHGKAEVRGPDPEILLIHVVAHLAPTGG
jgi:hypothetical protein